MIQADPSQPGGPSLEGPADINNNIHHINNINKNNKNMNIHMFINMHENTNSDMKRCGLLCCLGLDHGAAAETAAADEHCRRWAVWWSA